ncbi:ATP-binding cassette domain-containing protein [Wukongibacter baidiensis]|uniref:ABC transporter ATP-binding protein n=1 Tax=Wukongibacter baidiensis TaxID=1723361 RepID=UPI003D7FF8C9
MDIRIEGLVKIYGERTVVNIENMTLEKGRVYGVIGPNGAGKSTMLKIVAGLEDSSRGKTLYNENPLNDEILKNITYMSQRPYLLRTSVFNNISYPLKIRKYDKRDIEDKVNEIMKELGISDLSSQLATSLSGGESQKVALARALVFEPEILLLDEPTANIDPNSIELIEKVIAKRNTEKGMTAIIITHNMGQAKRLCDEVIFMDKGKVVECGKSEKLISNPQKDETKRFLSLYI